MIIFCSGISSVYLPDGVPEFSVVSYCTLLSVKQRGGNSSVGWLVEWLVPRLKTASTVVIDGLHWSGSLTEKLREGGVRVKGAITLPKSDEVVTASSGLVDAVTSGSVTHYDQPVLNDSATNATKRAIGSKGGWGFDGEDSTPVESVALALWGVRTSKRNPRRKQGLL